MEKRTFELPDSKTSFAFTESYSREALANLARDIVKDPELAKKFRENFQDMLAQVGIKVTPGDGAEITDEDILVALGHRSSEKQSNGAVAQGPVPLVIAAVIIGTLVANPITPGKEATEIM